jgi:hypothetical protein
MASAKGKQVTPDEETQQEMDNEQVIQECEQFGIYVHTMEEIVTETLEDLELI